MLQIAVATVSALQLREQLRNERLKDRSVVGSTCNADGGEEAASLLMMPDETPTAAERFAGIRKSFHLEEYGPKHFGNGRARSVSHAGHNVGRVPGSARR
jgi:hypothetical protein